jgi:hypothetical protein
MTIKLERHEAMMIIKTFMKNAKIGKRAIAEGLMDDESIADTRARIKIWESIADKFDVAIRFKNDIRIDGI